MAEPNPRIEKSVLDLTDEELDTKIQKLTRIVFSNNTNLARQAEPILRSLYEEQSRRNAKKFDEHLERQGVKMDEILNIDIGI